MSTTSKNKLLTWLVILLLLANAATLILFWFGKNKETDKPMVGGPREYLIKELSLTPEQSGKYKILADEHRGSADKLRLKMKEAKGNLYLLVKDTGATDSTKLAAAAAVSYISEQLDLLTINHFQKLRALLNEDQQKKFDSILKDLPGMMAPQRLPMGPRGGMQGPPPGAPPPPEGQMPPPKNN